MVGFCAGDNDHILVDQSSHNEKSATGHFCFSEFRAAAALPLTHIPSQGMTTASYYFKQHTQLQHPGTSLQQHKHKQQPTRAARQPSSALKEPSKRALEASRAGKDRRAQQHIIKELSKSPCLDPSRPKGRSTSQLREAHANAHAQVRLNYERRT